jgi:hypothetical protein
VDYASFKANNMPGVKGHPKQANLCGGGHSCQYLSAKKLPNGIIVAAMGAAWQHRTDNQSFQLCNGDSPISQFRYNYRKSLISTYYYRAVSNLQKRTV